MLIYQIVPGAVSTAVQDFNAADVKIRIPLCESIKVVEYGFRSLVTDPGTTGVLRLAYVDGTNAVVALDTFSPVAAAAVGDLVSRRVDVHLDTLTNRKLVSIEGTPGTLTEDTNGFVELIVDVSTAFGPSVTACPYVKFALAGTSKTAHTSQTVSP